MLTCCFIILLLSGCGYNVGSIANPQIKSIAFAPVENETYIPNISEYMRNALSEAFQVDGAYKVSNMYDADCILYGRVIKAEESAVDIRSATGGTTFYTSTFRIALTFEFTVVIPGQAEALIPTTQVVGSAQYEVPVDQFIALQNGVKQASWNAANKVVWQCTESW